MIVAFALLVSLVAVIVAVPGAIPVTTPDWLTVAISGLLVVHATTRSVTTAPFASRTVTVRVVLEPVETVAVVGESVTLPTGMLETVSAVVPLTPSTVAVIVAEPAVIALTVPSDATVATAVLELDQTADLPASTLPLASRAESASCADWPAIIVTGFGDTMTFATAPCATVMVDVLVFPSLAAVIVEVPGATAVTRPLVLTVATA